MTMKQICVTGADRGVGLALTTLLLEAGGEVFAGQYSPGAALAGLAARFPQKLHVLPLDVADSASVKEAAARIAAHTEKLDVLFNNAAILGDIEASVEDELDFAEMQAVYNVNALGALRVSNALTPLLLRGADKLIVNISSEAGSIGDCERTSWFAYCMSKSALNMQTALIHNRLRPQGGMAVAVHPGWVQTYMRGVKDEAATLTPEQSAAGIVETAQRLAAERPEKAAFVDYAGRPLPW
ncbi:SDR family NAD(P)-dependent oxidoreductase [Paenibacillus athensensis]|uniref:Short-chain dehydrogenase n=1 Tax=Paenibacillus athensensis TaxID=1967502 RepID=A0A4Y8Q4P2_9BACL|nr:SDR family NAD(P)-dependent oxidoreductase [Paenibacillus athensensis]MCD1258682.1 SDR family NAD(P)-dependent oxidoreductase [Paenibacillus athensensis]